MIKYARYLVGKDIVDCEASMAFRGTANVTITQLQVELGQGRKDSLVPREP